jgi:hypothetical protein
MFLLEVGTLITELQWMNCLMELAIIPTKSCCALRSHMIAGVVDSVEAYSWEKSSGERRGL